MKLLMLKVLFLYADDDLACGRANSISISIRTNMLLNGRTFVLVRFVTFQTPSKMIQR